MIEHLGVSLIFFAVALRGGILFAGEPEFRAVVGLLALYGAFLFAEMWFAGHELQERASRWTWLLPAYLLVQSALVAGLLFVSTAEDFFSLLFVPLSLDAVTFFGRRRGFLWITGFAALITGLMLGAQEGKVFGLAMGAFFSSLCFLFGAYAVQVRKAKAGHERNQEMMDELQRADLQLQGYEDQLAKLAVEQERNRLARELHDSVTQTVFSMNLAAQSARLLLGREPGLAAEQLARLEALGANAQREMQALISGLRPNSAAEMGLPGALHQLSAERKQRDGLNVGLVVTGERALSETESAALYAIAHEALTNIAKHSGDCEALIRLELNPGNSALVIEDHGRGFEPSARPRRRGHLGLAGMSDRARQIGWDLSVESRPGRGTRISVLEKPSGGS